jgi:uncharacterized phage infection (PIP) family protein YhgE
MVLEKLERKSEDLSSKINEVYKMLKEIGGIENLAELNKEIRKKIDEMKEALKYTERLATKTEKIFMDLSKSLEEFVVYKTRLDGLDETVRDLLKSIDAVNIKLENLPSKKELEAVRADLLLTQKQIEDIKKILPMVEAKMPETIVSLRKEKENILLFLNSLEEHFRRGVVSVGDYEDAKRRNLKKLAEIEERIKREWESMAELISSGKLGKEEKVEP